MTKYFNHLIAAETHINLHFIDFVSRPSANYTRQELSHFDAYAVLLHAEFEAYFESLANAAVDLAERRLRADRYNRIIYCLGAFYARATDEGESVQKVPSKDIWREKAGRAIKEHRRIITSNNGIKTSDI
jgi:hypothetical protein